MIIETAKKISGHTKQQQIWDETTKNIFLECARRWGKDWILTRKGLKNIIEDIQAGKGKEDHSHEDDLPRLHYWCIGPKYKHADILKKEMFRALRSAGFVKNKHYTYNKSERKLWLTIFDVLIEFRSADSPEDLVGEGIAGVIGTEVARWKNDVYTDNVQPALTDMDGWTLFDTTPKGRNWTDEIYNQCIAYDTRKPVNDNIKLKDIEWVYYHGTYKDQVMIPGYVKRVEKLKASMPPDDFDRNFMASRDSFQGQVFTGNSEDNRREKHEKKDYYRIFGGYDHGHTHRAGIVVVGITHDFKAEVLVAIGQAKLEFMSLNRKDVTICSIITGLQKEHNIDRWYCSHERPENILSLRKLGVPAMSWMKTEYTKNDNLGIDTERSKRTARYLFVNRMLYANYLFYLRDQRELIHDLFGVQWKELVDGRYSAEIVLDRNDDVTDALTMAIWSYVPIRRQINKFLTSFADYEDTEVA